MNISFQTLIALTRSLSLNKKDVTDETAIIIIIIGDIRPASTAACPKTNAPTIDIDVPTTKDILVSDSFNISNIRNITSASTTLGKGTPCLWIEKLINKLVGSASWLNVVSARYIPGTVTDIINAITLIILVTDTFLNFDNNHQ